MDDRDVDAMKFTFRNDVLLAEREDRRSRWQVVQGAALGSEGLGLYAFFAGQLGAPAFLALSAIVALAFWLASRSLERAQQRPVQALRRRGTLQGVGGILMRRMESDEEFLASIERIWYYQALPPERLAYHYRRWRERRAAQRPKASR